MPKVKICGITNIEDANLAIQLGAHALGFIFVESSPRYITIRQCKEITENLSKSSINKFGVFQNHKVEDVISTATECQLNTIQLHGAEDSSYLQKLNMLTELPVVKAYRLNENESNLDRFISSAKELEDYVEHFLLDGPGKGKTISKEAYLKFKNNVNKPMILAGGLSPQNIEATINNIQPIFIDACSRLEESKGKKSKQLMEYFFNKLQQK